MKKLLGLLIIIFITFGCDRKYSVEDEVYLKPDSTQVMIRWVQGNMYGGVYVDDFGQRHSVKFFEYEVYEKQSE